MFWKSHRDVFSISNMIILFSVLDFIQNDFYMCMIIKFMSIPFVSTCAKRTYTYFNYFFL